MDKLELEEAIHEKEGRLTNLERMRDKFTAQPNPLAVMRTEGRITEVVEDLHDMRQALAEFDERDGKIRTGANDPFLGADLNEAAGRDVLDEAGFAEAARRRDADAFRTAVEKGRHEDDGKGPRREGWAHGFDD
jgi:hypothetical protein